MKLLKSLIISMIVGLSLISCGTQPPVVTSSWYDIGTDGRMYVVFDHATTPVQIDSICRADTLNNNLHAWKKSSYRDAETNQIVYRYTYIKNDNTTYIISEYPDSLAITKRVIR